MRCSRCGPVGGRGGAGRLACSLLVLGAGAPGLGPRGAGGDGNGRGGGSHGRHLHLCQAQHGLAGKQRLKEEPLSGPGKDQQTKAQFKGNFTLILHKAFN